MWIIRQKEKSPLIDSEIALSQRITRRAVQKIWSSYQHGGLEALKEKPRERKADAIPIAHQQEILRWRKKRYGIHKIRAMLRQDQIHISKEKIEG